MYDEMLTSFTLLFREIAFLIFEVATFISYEADESCHFADRSDVVLPECIIEERYCLIGGPTFAER